METEYVQILRESLERKESLLKRIVVLNERQKDFFENPDTLPEELDKNIDAKGKLVDKIVALDDGFEQLYLRVEDALAEKPDEHKEEVLAMKELIRSITELSSKIQIQEQRNYELARTFYGRIKDQTKKIRIGQNALSRYYQGMVRQGVITPQFMDARE